MAEKGAGGNTGAAENGKTSVEGNGQQHDEDSDEDPYGYPAILVKGFKFSADDPHGATSVSSQVTAHFQKKRHGGGEVVGTAVLLDPSTMRVAFEEKDVALNVLQRHHTLKSGEQLRTKPEVFMHAQLVKLSPLVRRCVSLEELERLCRSCHVKLISDDELCGSWSAVTQLEKVLSSRLLPRYTAGSSTSGMLVNGNSATTPNNSCRRLGGTREAQLCSEFSHKAHVTMGAAAQTRDGVATISHTTLGNHPHNEPSNVMDYEEAGYHDAKGQHGGLVDHRKCTQQGKDEALRYKVPGVDERTAGHVMREKEVEILELGKKLNCRIEFENGALVIHGDRRAVQKACKKLLSLCKGLVGGEDHGDGDDHVHSAVLDVDKAAVSQAFNENKAEMDAIEAEHSCHIDYSTNPENVTVFASTATGLQGATAALTMVCQKYSQNRTSTKITNQKNVREWKDKIDVLPHLMKYLLQTEKDALETLFREHGGLYKVEDDCNQVQFLAGSEESLQACVDKFINLYQTRMAETRHTNVDVPPCVTAHALQSLLEDVGQIPEHRHCVVSPNSTSTALTVFGKVESVRAATAFLEDVVERMSEDRSSRRHRPTASCSIAHTSLQCRENCRRTTIGSVLLEVVHGDLTAENTDAIVNAANDRLDHAGGVAFALAQAAGRAMEDDSKRIMRKHKGPLRLGEAITTSAGHLKCKCIIHVVGPIWSIMPNPAAKQHLREACHNALREAEKLDVQSIAFPAISSGLYGMPKETCAEVMLEAFRIFCRRNPSSSVQKIRVVLIDQPTLRAFLHCFDQRFGDQESRGVFSTTKTVPSSSANRCHPPDGGNKSQLDEAARTPALNSKLSGQPASVHHSVLKKTANSSTLPSVKEPVINEKGIPRLGEKHPAGSSNRCSDQLSCEQETKSYAAVTSSKVTGDKQNGGSCVVHAGATLMTVTVSNKSSSTGHKAPNHRTGGKSSGVPSSKRKRDEGASPDRGHSPPKMSKPSGDPSQRQERTEGQTAGSATGASASADGSSDITCPICLCEIDNERKLECSHSFCANCLDQANQSGFKACPTCRKPIGRPEGTQPRGCTMTVNQDRTSLPGYPKCGTIHIMYRIPSGTQTQEHPNPGRHYSGDSRSAYLPDNKEGNRALDLLRKAFDARLIFTIGRSVTRGVDGVVVWNDIHHKTSRTGGSSCYGYPDDTYLKRLIEDLAARGIE